MRRDRGETRARILETKIGLAYRAVSVFENTGPVVQSTEGKGWEDMGIWEEGEGKGF